MISLICGIKETKQMNIWEGGKKRRERNKPQKIPNDREQTEG